MHRDQHSSIQMDGLEDDTIAAADTYHSDQSLTSSGCRPRARCTSAPPGPRCPVSPPVQLWQRRGAAMQSGSRRPMECNLLRRDGIGMIL